MGTKANPGKYDCHASAADDEPLFTVLARDDLAPAVVRRWAKRYLKKHTNADGAIDDERYAKYQEAMSCARAMETWRTAQ